MEVTSIVHWTRKKSESGSLLLKPFFHFFHNFILPKNLKLHLLTESCKG